MISGRSLKTVSILCVCVCASAKTLHVYAPDMNNLNYFILVVFIV